MSPAIDVAWEIREEDLAPLATGAAILGAGGGGNPYLGMLRAREVMRRGHRVRVVDPDAVPADALLVATGAMGSPVVSHEKLAGGNEERDAIRTLEAHLGRRVDAVAPLEMGGGNSMSALVSGALLDVPVLDGDGMGRAFPKLSMTTFLIYGVECSPAALADEKGNHVVIEHVDDPGALERIARAVTVELGGHLGLAMAVMNGEQARTTCVPRTLTLALRLGRGVDQARRAGSDPIDALLDVMGGKRLFRGKVVDVERRQGDGFARGTVRIKSFDGADELEVDFQNENLVARRDGVALAVVPDIISLVDSETGEPITTEVVRFGFRVDVVVLPPSPMLTTSEALEWVGPQAFGYDFAWPPAIAGAT